MKLLAIHAPHRVRVGRQAFAPERIFANEAQTHATLDVRDLTRAMNNRRQRLRLKFGFALLRPINDVCHAAALRTLVR